VSTQYSLQQAIPTLLLLRRLLLLLLLLLPVRLARVRRRGSRRAIALLRRQRLLPLELHLLLR